MARQIINVGTTANDGTGDTLRAAGQKMNQNFAELYEVLGGDSGDVTGHVSLSDDGIVFEGSNINNVTTTLTLENPTANRTIILPNASGDVVLADDEGVLQNKTLMNPVVTGMQFNDDDSSHQYIIRGGSLTSDQDVNFPDLTDSDTFVMTKHTQTLENKTLTSPIISAPVIENKRILDSNENDIISFDTQAAAVNNITLSNRATGVAPRVDASGNDTNINLALGSKGTGAIHMTTKFAVNHETKTANSTLNNSRPLSIFNATSGTSHTLDNGTVIGEIKYFVNKNTGTATITPTSLAGTSVSITVAENQTAVMIWDGSEWYLVSKTSNP